MDVIISSLDGNISRRVRLNRHEVRTFMQLKHKISQILGYGEEQIDIMKTDGPELVQENEEVSDKDLKEIRMVVHPSVRDVPEHLETKELDLINGTMETDTRAIMSCGHGITPENLYDYCWNMLLQRKLKFTCPALDSQNGRTTTVCDAEWSLYEVTLKAKLSTDERILFEMKLNTNHWQDKEGIQECPVCRTVCERQSPTNNRVDCLICRQSSPGRHEFCWLCLGPWKTENTEYCGNIQCSTAKGPKAIQEILRTCQKKAIDQYRNCPSVRICPGCKALVEHTQGCKRMPCKCKFQFCFVCLKTWDNGCGYNKTCSAVAPIQSI